MGGQLVRSASRKGGRVALSAVMIASLVVAMVPATAFGGWWRYNEPELVSMSPAGQPGDEWSEVPSISDDGMVVAFQSWADNLSPLDVNTADDGDSDVFVRDMASKTCDILATPEGATEPDRGSGYPAVSGDGRYVAFVSGRDYVSTDDNGDQDLYLYDRETGDYTLAPTDVDNGIGGRPENVAISGDGGFVAFTCYEPLVAEDTNYRYDVYIWDVTADDLTYVTDEPGGMDDPDRGARLLGMSDDGEVVAFLSGRGFVAGDTNGDQDIYVWERSSGDFTWADFNSGNGLDGWRVTGAMSADGEYLVFSTGVSLVPADDNSRTDVYRWHWSTDELDYVSEAPDEADETDRGSRSPAMSADGRYVAFLTGKDLVEEDTNGDQDIYVKDMETDEFKMLRFMPNGVGVGDDLDEMVMSRDGMWLAFSWERPGIVPAGEVATAVDPHGPEQVYRLYLGDVLAPGATRLAGADRYATAVAVSKDAFPNGADTVVIATGANWPDALGASALAGVVDGPVLLTPTAALPASVVAEIERLGAKHAYVVGGTTAVSEGVEDDLYDVLVGTVQRLGGADRYGTSRAVANKVIEISGDVYSGMACVATGANYPDALAGAPLAAGLEWPILLANPKTGAVAVPAATTGAVILGGTAAVPSAVETALKADLGATAVTRVGGTNRYDTAAKVAAFGVENGLMWNGVGIASGTNYPDALAGGTAVGLQRSVMLLTTPDKLDSYAKTALETHKAHIESVRIFGGTSALSSAVETAVKTALGM